MGDIIIRLRGNAKTGEREIVIHYESDDDRTPMEHEQRHREIVEMLVREGVITREDRPPIVFEEQPQAETEARRIAEGQG
jgi:hypothetical protein